MNRRHEPGTWRDRLEVEEETDAATAVCVIEDDADLRSTLASTLRNEGYQVVEAADGARVIGQMALFPRRHGLSDVELIITDHRMPGATGLELLSYLRDSEFPVRVILMSAFLSDDVRDEARRLGVSAVLAKPLDLDEFVKTVRGVAPPN